MVTPTIVDKEKPFKKAVVEKENKCHLNKNVPLKILQRKILKFLSELDYFMESQK